jgi:hypothetical protein
LQKGFTDEYIINLSSTQKAFYEASMYLHFEEEKAKWETT